MKQEAISMRLPRRFIKAAIVPSSKKPTGNVPPLMKVHAGGAEDG